MSLSSCGLYLNGDINADHVIGTVMSDGMTISLQNTDCFSLSIKAEKGLRRSYTWNGGTRSWTLTPRTEKWYGAYGAYSPGDGHHWKNHDGVTRLLADEAVINYVSYDQLLCAISSSEDKCREKYFHTTNGEKLDLHNFDFEYTLPSALSGGACSAYTDDGLYVSVKKVEGPGDGGTLYVTVKLLMVAGEPVRDLPGSSNERIKVSNSNK